MSWTLCTSGAAVIKAGVNANADIRISGAFLADWSNEAESIISDQARVDVVANFGDFTANGKQILQNLCTSMIAQKIVVYDMFAYVSLREAETILDVLENDIRRALNMIEEDKIKTYLKVT